MRLVNAKMCKETQHSGVFCINMVLVKIKMLAASFLAQRLTIKIVRPHTVTCRDSVNFFETWQNEMYFSLEALQGARPRVLTVCVRAQILHLLILPTVQKYI